MYLKLSFLLPMIFIICAKSHANTDSQSHLESAIIKFTEEMIYERFSDFDDFSIEMAYFDKKTHVKPCNTQYDVHKRFGNITHGRITLEITCAENEGWRLRIPVIVNIYKDIFIAQQALNRGKILQASDFVLSKQKITKLTQGYFFEDTQLIGKVVSRPIRQGSIIKPNMVKEPILVKRGSQVKIINIVHGIVVQSQGIALKSGVRNEIIPVKNKKSHRIIEAKVGNEGTVYINS